MTRIVLDLEPHVEFTASQLSSPDRLMIELRGTGKGRPPPVTGKVTEDDGSGSGRAAFGYASHRVAGAPEVATRRLHETRNGKKPELRKFEPPPHIEIAAAADPTAETLPPELLPSSADAGDGEAGPRLRWLPFRSAKSELPPAAGFASGAVPGSKTGREDRKRRRPAFAAEPAKRNTNGERSLTRVLGLKLGRVVIDPGHGGKDVGTHGPSGLYEKDVVLDVARRLGALIEDRLGSEVIYTRSDDTFIPLEARTRIANDRKADLFLSIHANSSPLRTAAGVEMYYLNFTTSKAALDVAARENAGSSQFHLRSERAA